MQASLNDLASDKRNTPSFVICQRVLQKCHELVFEDPSSSSPTTYPSLIIPFRSRFLTKKVKPHLEPAVVGIGCILAGVPGLPQVSEEVGDVAIVQGQRETTATRPRLVNIEDADTDNVIKILNPEMSVSTEAADQGTITPSDEDDEFDISPDSFDTKSQPVPIRNDAGTSSETSMSQVQQQAFSVFAKFRNLNIKAARTTPALIHMHGQLADSSNPRSIEGSQPDSFISTSRAHVHSHCLSTPAISELKSLPVLSHIHSMDSLLQKYDLDSQRLILRGHYLRLEVWSNYYISSNNTLNVFPVH